MAAVTILSNFGAQEEEIRHYSYFLPHYSPEVMGPDDMILVLFFFQYIILSQLFHSLPLPSQEVL